MPRNYRRGCDVKQGGHASSGGQSNNCMGISSALATTDPTTEWRRLPGPGRRSAIGCSKLYYSRAFIVRAYLLQTHEMLFDAHNHAFRVLGGVPRRGIYVNMRTAMDKVGRGKERSVNVRFSTMTGHYLFEAEFRNPASGWEKGQVEKNVQDARHRPWQTMPPFESLDALNGWLEQRCRELWGQTRHGGEPGMIADVWAQEVESLMPVGRPFDGFVEYTKRVSSTCLIHLERNRYSVPASFANRPVSLRVYPDKLAVVAENHVVCEYPRIIDRTHNGPERTVYDWRHYLAVIQRKPGALRNGAPFLELPDAFKRLPHHLLCHTGGDREMVALVRVRPSIEARDADLWFLPACSPDLNPIEQGFAKLKARLRKAEPRSREALWQRTGQIVHEFTPTQCANFLANAGYGQLA
jgi:hypothetical protein